MKTIDLKEMYEAIDKWYQSQDEKKIKYLLKERLYDDGKPNAKLQLTVNWYLDIKKLKDKNKSLIFGDNLISLEDISEHMLNNILPEKSDDNDDHYHPYDEDGYATNIDELRDFWTRLNNRKILDVAGNATIDSYELDVNGGRCYYMHGEDIICMIFNYLYYTLNLSAEKFDDNICNSGDITDELAFYYSGKSYAEKGLEIYLPTTIVLDDMYQKLVIKNNKNDIDRFNRVIKSTIDEFKNKEIFAEKLEILKTLTI